MRTCLLSSGDCMTASRLSADIIAEHLGVTKDTVHAWFSCKGTHKAGRLWKLQVSEIDQRFQSNDSAQTGVWLCE